MYYKRASDLKNNKMPVVWFQFQQLCQVLGTSVENIISTQKDLAAICKCSLILKKRLRRLIALSCLFLLCPAESQHSRERQLCERPGLAVLVETPAFGSDDTAESLVPSWTLSGLIITLQGTHWAGRAILWEIELPTMQRSWSTLQITAACSIGSLDPSKLFHGGSLCWGAMVFFIIIIIITIIIITHTHTYMCVYTHSPTFAAVDGGGAVCSAKIIFTGRYGEELYEPLLLVTLECVVDKEGLTLLWKWCKVGLLILKMSKTWKISVTICSCQLCTCVLPSGSQEAEQRIAFACSCFLKSPRNGIQQH